MIRSITSATLRAIPWSVRNHIKVLPIIGPAQR